MFVLKTDFPSLMFTRHPSFSVGTARALQGAALPKENLVTNGVMVFAPLADSRRGRSAVAVRGE